MRTRVMMMIVVMMMTCIAVNANGQSTQCTAKTKSGAQCKNRTNAKDGLCRIHNPNFESMAKVKTVQCSAITKAGKQCRHMTHSPNGKCKMHGGN